MITEGRIALARFAMIVLLTLTATLGVGCADTPSGGGQSNDNFEIRAMIAADRQQMQAMDERMRRIEGQIQDLGHNPLPPAAGDANAAPARQEAPAPPPMSAPAAQTVPAGAPPSPGAPMGAPPAGGAITPGGEAVPPGAAAAPAGAAAAEGAASAPAAAPGTPEGTTIASAPGPAAGATPPSDEEGGAAEAGSAPGGPPEASANDESGSEAGAAENGNPEAQPPPAASAPPAAAGAEESAPSGGEEVASAPSSSAPENAPAAIPPARWPDDLAREMQSSASAKGGAGKLFHSGLDAMKSHDYGAAVERFGMIQKKFPHSDLTEPAAYFSASALNEMGKYDQAILQYNDLVMRYPKGKYAGEALLRESQDFVQINDKVDARLTLQKLVNEHAGTPEAATASAMLKSLESD